MTDSRNRASHGKPEAPLRDANGTLWTTLPEPRRAGWYLIEHPAGRTTTQAVLQVTDVSAGLAVPDRQSLVWANDLATKRPLAAAAVQADGVTLGRTDAIGLLKVDSPAEWRQSDTDGCATSRPPIVTVTAGAKSAFIPTTGSMGVFGEGSSIDWWGGLADPRYWLLFETDRSKYRPTDTVNAGGWSGIGRPAPSRPRSSAPRPRGRRHRHTRRDHADKPLVRRAPSRPLSTHETCRWAPIAWSCVSTASN